MSTSASRAAGGVGAGPPPLGLTSRPQRRRSRPVPVSAVLAGAPGLALIAAAFALTRTGHGGAGATGVFWLGMVLALIPLAARLFAADTSRRDRLGLVVLLGALTYAIKVLHDPITFVIGDELVHVAAALDLASTHTLGRPFADQGVNVAVDYPGLELFTVGLARVCGLPLFVSGLVTIGVARVMILLAVFTLGERLGGSSRVGAVAALLFCANSNFLLWSAQFSYESLALPLFAVALALLLARGPEPGAAARATPALVVLIAALTVTHHLTSLALVGVLWFLTLASLRGGAWRGYRVLGLALVASAASAAWLALAAPEALGYLGSVVSRTTSGIRQALAGGGRVPFETTSFNSFQWPLPEQLASYAAVLLLGVLAIVVLWRYRRPGMLRTPGHVLLELGLLAFLALFALRLSPGAWESANRGQELLFIAPATLIATHLVRMLRRARRPRRTGRLMVAGALLAICGGIIGGWESRLLLSAPLEVRAGAATLTPQGETAARWAMARLGSGATYVADETTGRELMVAGARRVFFGSSSDTEDLILHGSTLPAWQRTFLRAHAVDYIVLDRRQISTDVDAGYYFPTAADPSGGQGYYSAAAQRKFSGQPVVSTIYAAGDLSIYDVRGLWAAPPACVRVGAGLVPPGVTCTQDGRRLTYGGRSGLAIFSHSAVRYLGAGAQPTAAGTTWVTVAVQAQNYAHAPVRFAPFRDSPYLQVAGRRLRRVATADARRDALTGPTPVPALSAVERSLTFAVSGAAPLRALATGRARLYVAAPGSPSDVAVFRVTIGH